MKLHNKLSIAYSLFKAKFFRVKIPIIVSWLITQRCNAACKYCSSHKIADSEELDTETVFLIARQLSQLGTKAIILTGGEPMLRDDIGEIVDFCVYHNMAVIINSNGYQIKDRIEEIEKIHMLNLSLDGPENINDKIRGAGSFKQVMEAANIASEKGIRVSFTTVLSRVNLNKETIDYLLGICAEFDATVTFQPVIKKFLRGEGFHSLAPSKEEYKSIIEYIISIKRKSKYIRNSLTALKYFRSWPDYKPIKCAGPYIYRRIDNKGNVTICGRVENKGEIKNCLRDNFKEAILNIGTIDCKNCWCASRVEMNYLFSLYPEVAINTLWNTFFR